MEDAKKIVSLVLKAVALARGTVSIILGILKVADAGTQVTMLSIALAALQDE